VEVAVEQVFGRDPTARRALVGVPEPGELEFLELLRHRLHRWRRVLSRDPIRPERQTPTANEHGSPPSRTHISTALKTTRALHGHVESARGNAVSIVRG